MRTAAVEDMRELAEWRKALSRRFSPLPWLRRYWLIVTFEFTIVMDFCSMFPAAGADCATATVESVPKFDQQLIGL